MLGYGVSLFPFIPKVFSGVLVWTLSRSVKFFYTRLSKTSLYELCAEGYWHNEKIKKIKQFSRTVWIKSWLLKGVVHIILAIVLSYILHCYLHTRFLLCCLINNKHKGDMSNEKSNFKIKSSENHIMRISILYNEIIWCYKCYILHIIILYNIINII